MDDPNPLHQRDLIRVKLIATTWIRFRIFAAAATSQSKLTSAERTGERILTSDRMSLRLLPVLLLVQMAIRPAQLDARSGGGGAGNY